MFKHALAAIIILLGIAGESFAGTISISVESSITTHSDKKTAELKCSVTNNGDEAAREVAIDMPLLNEREDLSASLAPAGTAHYTKEVSFQALNIDKDGAYALPFRVLYKDGNRFSFSAPQVALFHVGTPPSSAVSLEMINTSPGTTIELANKTSVEFSVRSVSVAPVSVRNIYPLSALELKAKLQDPVTAETLSPGATLKHRIEIENASALSGSTYPVFVIVEGERSEKHFAEFQVFLVKITEATGHVRTVVIALLALTALVLLFTQNRHKKPSA